VRLLLATLSAQTERDQRLAQLNDELALKSALLEQAKADAAEATKRAGLELRKHADRLLAQTSRVEQKDAELVNVQTKLDAQLDELLLFRDQHVRALQKVTSRAAGADERSQRACEQIGQVEDKLAEVRAEMEVMKSELEVVRLRFTDAENCWAKSKTEPNALHAPSTAGLVSPDRDQTICGLVERIRAMEDEVASLQWNEKSLEEVVSRNEG
jgi:chromosome segregation ATPase